MKNEPEKNIDYPAWLEEKGLEKSDHDRLIARFEQSVFGKGGGGGAVAFQLRGANLSLSFDDYLRALFGSRCPPASPTGVLVTESDWHDRLMPRANGLTLIYRKVEASTYFDGECWRARVCWDVQCRIFLSLQTIELSKAARMLRIHTINNSWLTDEQKQAEIDGMGPEPSAEGSYAHERLHVRIVHSLIDQELGFNRSLDQVIQKFVAVCEAQKGDAEHKAAALRDEFLTALDAVINAAGGHRGDAIDQSFFIPLPVGSTFLLGKPPDGGFVPMPPGESMPANGVTATDCAADRQTLSRLGYEPLTEYPTCGH